MSQTEEVFKRGVSWMHIVTFAIATGVSAILAIYAVFAVPVAPFPGVSGLYFAAAIYVPLSLWLGMWGPLAGYFSCVILGFATTPFGPFSFVWSLCDFFEGLIPLVAFKLFKVDPELKMQRPGITWALFGLLVLDLILGVISYALTWSEVFLASIFLSLIIVILMGAANPKYWKSWIFYAIFGIIGGAFGSALFGIGTLVLGGFAPAEAFWVGFLGWFIGDVLVIGTIGTILMIALTPRIKRTPIYVRGWFS